MRSYEGTRREHAHADAWCTAVYVGEPYSLRYERNEEGEITHENAGYDERTRLTQAERGHRSRLLDATIAFNYRSTGCVLIKPMLEEACEAHAGGAIVDVGRRSLFETGRWPGAPEYEEPMHEQLRVAADAFSVDTSELSTSGDDGVLRQLMGSAIAAAAGGVVEAPSAGALRHAKTLRGRALQSESESLTLWLGRYL